VPATVLAFVMETMPPRGPIENTILYTTTSDHPETIAINGETGVN